MFKIGQLAALAGVSVRTLHHYDEIDLVKPSARSDAGYRLYDTRDLEGLQQVLFFRETRIRPRAHRLAHLRNRDPTFDRKKRCARSPRAARPRTRKKRTRCSRSSTERFPQSERRRPWDRRRCFQASEKEARDRWGHTSEYAESARPARRRTEKRVGRDREGE